VQIAIDTLFLNTADVERAVASVKQHLGLAPFLSFELIVRNGSSVPISIFQLEGGSLEILGRAEGARPASGVISFVEMATPIAGRVEIELAPNAPLVCHPGPKPRFHVVHVETHRSEEDARLLGARTQDGQMRLGDVELRLIDRPGADTVPTPYFPGWHRLSSKVQDLDRSKQDLLASGFEVLVPSFRVMPGLDEAMLHTPSGLIVQITRERLWRMLPSIAREWLTARLAHRPMRFSETVAGATG
jgi:hypothetical protein